MCLPYVPLQLGSSLSSVGAGCFYSSYLCDSGRLETPPVLKNQARPPPSHLLVPLTVSSFKTPRCCFVTAFCRDTVFLVVDLCVFSLFGFHFIIIIDVAAAVSDGYQEEALKFVPLQRPVFGLVAGDDALAPAPVLAQFGHFLTQRRVLALQEGRPHGDLVLLQSAGVAGALRRHVVLLPPGPVLIILQR